MPIITWSEKYSVNIDKIDQQHKKLIDIINRLFDTMKQGKAKGVISEILVELQEYTVYHFTDEEYLLKKYHYPELDNHIKQHQFFIDELSNLRGKMASGKLGIGLEMMQFLSDWLTNHIRGNDKQYSGFLVEKGVV
jgi:hemerythrin